MNIKEDFLQYIWQSLKFDLRKLQSTTGESLTLLDQGYLNTNAGPDFINGRIKIDDILWVGSIEIHVFSDDWYKHKHQEDTRYDNVILHVVLEENTPVIDRQGRRIPCLEMKNRIPGQELRKYKLFQSQKHPISCFRQLKEVPSIYRTSAVEKGVTQRLLRKAGSFDRILKQHANDWEHSLIIQIFRNFGATVNADAFEHLGKSIPPALIRKARARIIDLEALLFGYAGFLEKEYQDEYPNQLKHLYTFQKLKYKIKPKTFPDWKFMRMRPGNFPTIRLAQLSALLHHRTALVNALKQMENVKEIIEYFALPLSGYWQEHYHFDKASKKPNRGISRPFIHLLIINTLSPFLYTLGVKKNDDKMKAKAFDLLSLVPPENNKFTRQWEKLDFKISSGMESQGLLELYQAFCQPKKCLQCPIGHYLMKNDR